MHEYEIIVTPKGYTSFTEGTAEAETAKEAYEMIYPEGYEQITESLGGSVEVRRTDGNNTNDTYYAYVDSDGHKMGSFVFCVDDVADDMPMITAYDPNSPEENVWNELIDIDHCCLIDTDSDARAQTTVDTETAAMIRDYVMMQLERIACRTEAHLWYTDGKYDGAGDCDTHAIRLELLLGVEHWGINN